MGVDLAAEVARERDALIALRRDLHAHPELAFQERRTMGIVVERLRALGWEVRAGEDVGLPTAVVADLSGGLPGPRVCVRPDMDALPLDEEIEVPYRSETPGAMHACGHDGHVALGLALASMLARQRETLPGAVRLAFQPAEEVLGGGLPMVRAGLLEGVDTVFVLHLLASEPAGVVRARDGVAYASSDVFRVTVHGRGGHGSAPHRAVDPIGIGAHLVQALSRVVSHEVDAADQAVLTVGSFQGGTAPNIIPPSAVLRGTLRTANPTVRQELRGRVEQVCAGIASSLKGAAELVWEAETPPVVNAPEWAAFVRSVAGVPGTTQVIEGPLVMGSDDAAHLLNERPGCYFGVGIAEPEKGFDAPNHSPRFGFDDERVLPHAAAVLAAVVLARLGS
jgi:amidohydrolase